VSLTLNPSWPQLLEPSAHSSPSWLISKLCAEPQPTCTGCEGIGSYRGISTAFDWAVKSLGEEEFYNWLFELVICPS